MIEKQIFNPKDALQSYKGTPLYMAPEKNLKKEKSEIDKVDIYSLGVILYQMLTGSYPTITLDKGSD